MAAKHSTENKEYFPLDDDSRTGKPIPGNDQKERTKNVGAKVVSTFKNVGKMTRGAGAKIMDSYMPDVKEFSTEAKAAVDSFKSEAVKDRDKLVSKIDKNNSGESLTKNLKKNSSEFLKDFGGEFSKIKTGDLFKDAEGNFGGDDDDFDDLDFDFSMDDDDDDFEMDFGDDEESSTEESSSSDEKTGNTNVHKEYKSTKNYKKQNVFIDPRSSKKSTAAILHGLGKSSHNAAATMISISNRQFAVDETRFQEHMNYQRGILDSTQKMASYFAEQGTRDLEAADEFRTKNLALQQDTIALLKDIKASSEAARMDELHGSSFGDDFEEEEGGAGYGKRLFGSLKGVFENTAIGQMLGAGEMMGSMGEVGGVSPGKMAANMLLGSLPGMFLTQGTKMKMSRVNETFKNLGGAMNMKFNTLASHSDNKMIRSMASVMKTDDFKLSGTNAGLEDPHAKTHWDAQSHRTLNTVIPGFLSKIHSAVSGEEEIFYDYKSGAFRKSSSVRKQFEVDKERAYKSSYDARNIIDTLSHKVGEDEKLPEDVEPTVVRKDFDQIVKNLAFYNKSWNTKLAMENPDYQSQIGAKLEYPGSLNLFARNFGKLSSSDQNLFQNSLAETKKSVEDFNKSIREHVEKYGGGVMVGELQQEDELDSLKGLRESALFDPDTYEEGSAAKRRAVKRQSELGRDISRIESGRIVSNQGLGLTGAIDGSETNTTSGALNNIYNLLLDGIVVFPRNVDQLPDHLALRMGNRRKSQKAANEKFSVDEETERENFERQKALIEDEVEADKKAELLRMIGPAGLMGSGIEKARKKLPFDAFFNHLAGGLNNITHKALNYGEEFDNEGSDVREEQFDKVMKELKPRIHSDISMVRSASEFARNRMGGVGEWAGKHGDAFADKLSRMPDKIIEDYKSGKYNEKEIDYISEALGFLDDKVVGRMPEKAQKGIRKVASDIHSGLGGGKYFDEDGNEISFDDIYQERMREANMVHESSKKPKDIGGDFSLPGSNIGGVGGGFVSSKVDFSSMHRDPNDYKIPDNSENWERLFGILEKKDSKKEGDEKDTLGDILNEIKRNKEDAYPVALYDMGDDMRTFFEDLAITPKGFDFMEEGMSNLDDNVKRIRKRRMFGGIFKRRQEGGRKDKSGVSQSFNVFGRRRPKKGKEEEAIEEIDEGVIKDIEEASGGKLSGKLVKGLFKAGAGGVIGSILLGSLLGPLAPMIGTGLALTGGYKKIPGMLKSGGKMAMGAGKGLMKGAAGLGKGTLKGLAGLGRGARFMTGGGMQLAGSGIETGGNMFGSLLGGLGVDSSFLPNLGMKMKDVGGEIRHGGPGKKEKSEGDGFFKKNKDRLKNFFSSDDDEEKEKFTLDDLIKRAREEKNKGKARGMKVIEDAKSLYKNKKINKNELIALLQELIDKSKITSEEAFAKIDDWVEQGIISEKNGDKLKDNFKKFEDFTHGIKIPDSFKKKFDELKESTKKKGGEIKESAKGTFEKIKGQRNLLGMAGILAKDGFFGLKNKLTGEKDPDKEGLLSRTKGKLKNLFGKGKDKDIESSVDSSAVKAGETAYEKYVLKFLSSISKNVSKLAKGNRLSKDNESIADETDTADNSLMGRTRGIFGKGKDKLASLFSDGKGKAAGLFGSMAIGSKLKGLFSSDGEESDGEGMLSKLGDKAKGLFGGGKDKTVSAGDDIREGSLLDIKRDRREDHMDQMLTSINDNTYQTMKYITTGSLAETIGASVEGGVGGDGGGDGGKSSGFLSKMGGVAQMAIGATGLGLGTAAMSAAPALAVTGTAHQATSTASNIGEALTQEDSSVAERSGQVLFGNEGNYDRDGNERTGKEANAARSGGLDTAVSSAIGGTKTVKAISNTLGSAGKTVAKGSAKMIGRGADRATGGLLPRIFRFLKRVLTQGRVGRFIGKGASKVLNLLKSAVNKAQAGGRAVKARIAAKLGTKWGTILSGIGTAIGVGMIAKDFIGGMSRARRFFKLPKGIDPTTPMRITSGVVNLASNWLTFGLVDPGWLTRKLYDIFGSEESKNWIEEGKRFGSDRARILGVDSDRLVEYESMPLLQRLWGKARRSAGLLQFGNDEKGIAAFERWRDEKYEPLENMREDLADDFGGEKIVNRKPGTEEEAELISEYRNTFLDQAKSFVSENNLGELGPEGGSLVDDETAEEMEQNDEVEDASDLTGEQESGATMVDDGNVEDASEGVENNISGNLIAGGAAATAGTMVSHDGGSADMSPDELTRMKQTSTSTTAAVGATAGAAAYSANRGQTETSGNPPEPRKHGTRTDRQGNIVDTPMETGMSEYNDELSATKNLYQEQKRHNRVSETFYHNMMNAMGQMVKLMGENLGVDTDIFADTSRMLANVGDGSGGGGDDMYTDDIADGT